MDVIYTTLEGLAGFFNMFSESTGTISILWGFAEYMADFLSWMLSFFQGISG